MVSRKAGRPDLPSRLKDLWLEPIERGMRRKQREACDLARGLMFAGCDFEEVVARVRQAADLDEEKTRKLIRRALASGGSRSSIGWNTMHSPYTGSLGGGDWGSFGGCDGGSGGVDAGGGCGV
jgi:hypothetical protein